MVKTALFATIFIWAFIAGVKIHSLFSVPKVAEYDAAPIILKVESASHLWLAPEKMSLGDIEWAHNQTFSGTTPTLSRVAIPIGTSSNPQLVLTADTATTADVTIEGNTFQGVVKQHVYYSNNALETSAKLHFYAMSDKSGNRKTVQSMVAPSDFVPHLKGHAFVLVQTFPFENSTGGYNVYRCTKHKGEEMRFVGWAR